MFKIEIWENNPILRKEAEKVTDKNYKEAVNLGKKMIKYIKNPENGWIGLAAPQIWVSLKLIVLWLPKTWEDENFKYIMMINPEILEYSDDTNIDTEWCLSLPWIKEDVKRPSKIKVSYMDEKKAKKTLILEWLQARIVQHEYDHIIWKLFIDYNK